MICKKCNNEIMENSSFCPICGNTFSLDDTDLISIEECSDETSVIQSEEVNGIKIIDDGFNIDEDFISFEERINEFDDHLITINDDADINGNSLETDAANILIEEEKSFSDVNNKTINVVDDENNDINLDNSVDKGKKEKSILRDKTKFIMFFLLIVVFIAIITSAIYVYILSTNKNIMFKSITNITNKTVDLVMSSPQTQLNEIDSKYLSTNLNVSFINNGLNEFINLDGTKFNAKIITDKYYDEVNLESNIVDGDEKISISTIIKDKKIYNLVRDIYNNYYYKDYEKEMDINMAFNSNECKYFVKIFSEVINKNINNKDFLTSREKINVLGKEYSVKKVSYAITSKKLKTIETEVLMNVLNDKKALKILEIHSSNSIDEIKKLINIEIENIKNSDGNDETKIFYNMYVKNINTIIKHEFIIDDKIKNEKNVFSLENIKNQYIVKVDSKGKTFILLNFNVLEKGKTTFNGTMDAFSITGNYDKIGEKSKLFVEIGTDEFKNNIIFLVNTAEDKGKNSLKYNVDVSLTVPKDTIENNEEIKFGVVISTDTVGINEMPPVDISTSQDIIYRSDLENDEFEKKIYNLPVVKKLFDLFGTFTNGVTNESNTNTFDGKTDGMNYVTKVNVVK